MKKEINRLWTKEHSKVVLEIKNIIALMKNSMKSYEDKFEKGSQEVREINSMSKKEGENRLEMIEDQCISLEGSLSWEIGVSEIRRRSRNYQAIKFKSSPQNNEFLDRKHQLMIKHSTWKEVRIETTHCEISEHSWQRKDPKSFQETKQATDKGAGIRWASYVSTARQETSKPSKSWGKIIPNLEFYMYHQTINQM